MAESLTRYNLAPNDEVIWHSPFSDRDVLATYRGYENGKAVLWGQTMHLYAEYKDLRRP